MASSQPANITYALGVIIVYASAHAFPSHVEELHAADVAARNRRRRAATLASLFSTKGDAMPHVLFFKGGKEIARVKGPQKPLVAKLAKEHAEPIAE